MYGPFSPNMHARTHMHAHMHVLCAISGGLVSPGSLYVILRDPPSPTVVASICAASRLLNLSLGSTQMSLFLPFVKMTLLNIS